MSKKVYKDDLKNEEKITKEKVDNAKDDKSDNKDTSDAGASGFSDEAEKEFQEKKKGNMAKLHNVVSKGLIPPKSDQQGKKGKWNDLKIRVKWSLLLASLFYLILFAGHIYSSIMVAVIAISIFYELIDLLK